MAHNQISCGHGCYLGVEWNATSTGGTLTIAPDIYRYDEGITDNYGSSFDESMTLPDGTLGRWYGYSWGSGSGWRVVDEFSSRTYNKTHSTQTIYLNVITDSEFGTYNGGWYTLGADTYTWTYTIPAKTSYTVSYNANGGTGAPSSQKKWYGETLTLTTSTPTRTGYTFAGWNTKADGTGTNYSKGGSYTANAGATLYAKWTLNTYTVSYNANGGSGSVSSQTKQYGVPLTLASGGFTKSYYTLDGWATSASGNVAYGLGASYTGNAALSLYAHWKVNIPSAPTNVSASRVSDTSANVTWTRGADADTTYSRIYVERSTDGADFVLLGYVAGTATSYSDTTTTANHAYQYRVRAYNSTGYSSYGTSGTIYTTPAAPQGVSGERTGTGTSVLLTVSNSNTNTATGFDVQYRAEDSDTWNDATVASSTGMPVETINLDNMGGSYYFRVRNTRSNPSLSSGWTESSLVVTITPPNAPTLVYPSSGAVVSASGSTQSVTFEWQHNPIDGSAQTAAEMRYRKTTVQTWTTVTTTTAQTKAVTLDEGYSYVWQARTKGTADDFGPWSNTQSFDLYNPPTVSITQPSGTVIGMPLAYTVSYLDNHGTFASGTIAIKLNGTTLYSEPLPTTSTTVGTASPITGEITTNEFLPSSGNTYTLEVAVRSSDTLTASVSQSMPVNMGEPYHGTLDIQNDPETGYVSLTVGWDTSTGSVAATYATVYRVTADSRLLMGDNLSSGAGILDKYAPLNTPYHYEIVTHAASTAIAVEDIPNEVETPRWFVYWGENVAWAEWNPAGSYTLSRPEKTRVHYVGREYPVSYDGTALDEAHNMTFTWWESHDGWMDNFSKLMHDGGRGIYKSVDGKVFRADFEVEISPEYTSITRIGTISLSIVRIDGDAL